jgi:hypothetical protein
MKTIIFKSEKKAKNYEIRSLIKQHIYSENELIKTVRTDNIDKILEDEKLKVIAKEIK